MSEETSEEIAELLHMFGPEAARSFKRMEPIARDVLVVSKVLSEAQRLQAIVARLTRQEQTLTQECTELAGRLSVVAEQLGQITSQLANEDRLLDEARTGAEARIAEELDTWREQQLVARRQEIDGLMAETEEKHHAAAVALTFVATAVKNATNERERLQAGNEILRQTRRELVAEIATAD